MPSNQYKGQLDQAKAGAEKSDQDFARAEALYKANAMTQTRLRRGQGSIRFEPGHGGDRAGRRGAGRSSRWPIAKCGRHLTAKFSSRNIELGVLVGSGTTAFTMGETQNGESGFWSSGYGAFRGVQLGQEAGGANRNVPQAFIGQITAISPQADQKSRTFQVEVTLPNPQGLLKIRNGGDAGIGTAPSWRTGWWWCRSARSFRAADGAKTFTCFRRSMTARKMWRGSEPCSPDAAFGNMVAIVERRERGRPGDGEWRDAGERRRRSCA